MAAESGIALPKKSPFELRGGSPAPVVAANETIEFAGVSLIGKQTDLIFYDKTAKKSHWIGLGETKEGIAVLNYDERREEAVVKINGVQKTLALRKVSGPVSTPRPVAPLPASFNAAAPATFTADLSGSAPVPVANTNIVPNPLMAEPAAATASSNSPAAPAPGSPAEIQARQETEARMLVSDLLEIGMAQRRAYEEAQRKAASGNAVNSAQPAQPNP